MKHPASRTLYDHWLTLRHGRLVPDRKDLDPVAIRGVLSHTFMLEVDGRRSSGRSYPVRVSGTRLDALFGRSIKDAAFTTLWHPGCRTELQTVAEAVLDEGRAAVVGGMAGPAGEAPVTVELLMLPLRCHGKTHARMLCSLVPLTVPTWLGLKRVQPMELAGWRLIEPQPETASPAVRPSIPQAASGPSVARFRFAVVEGGKSAEAPTPAIGAQSRIKGIVTGSRETPLSTRSS